MNSGTLMTQTYFSRRKVKDAYTGVERYELDEPEDFNVFSRYMPTDRNDLKFSECT